MNDNRSLLFPNKKFSVSIKKKNQMFLTIHRDIGIYIEIKSRFLQQNFS